MPFLPCEIVETSQPVNASVIWLHGLGASGHDFVPVVPMLQLPASLGIRFVFPHAPEIPVTVNGGMIMPAWYDILALDIERKIDHAQILASSRSVADLIDRELERGIASDRIVLAGFSQGGAVAYQAALTYPKPLAGLLAMSTYFATEQSLQPHAANRNIPIQIFHGSADDMVPEVMAEKAMTALVALGYCPRYKNYPMGHEVNLQELGDISIWLQQVLGEQASV